MKSEPKITVKSCLLSLRRLTTQKIIYAFVMADVITQDILEASNKLIAILTYFIFCVELPVSSPLNRKPGKPSAIIYFDQYDQTAKNFHFKVR